MDGFITEDTIEQSIRSIDATAKNIQIINDGTTNIIGIVDKSKVYRFPRNVSALADQRFEAGLLKLISDKLIMPTPGLLDVKTNPECVVVTYLMGDRLTVHQVQKLTEQALRTIIRQVLNFSVNLNSVISPKVIDKLELQYFGQSRDARLWEGYLTYALRDTFFPGKLWLEKLAHRQFKNWEAMVSNSTLPYIVVHDDLQVENMLFEDKHICGILDFGDMTTGTISQELRQLMRISDQAIEIAITEYEKMTGIVINSDEIKNWSITQEIAAYCRWLAKGDLNHPSFIRSQQNLRKWLPDFPG